MPEPIQSGGAATSLYDASLDICDGLQTRDPYPPGAAATDHGLPAADPAVLTLVNGHDSRTKTDCRPQQVAVAQAGVAVAGSLAAMAAATPTLLGVLPGIVGFIGSAVALGKTVADYQNCEDGLQKKPAP
jgi:hypothetical protein